MALAGDRPPRYGNIETGRSLLPGSHRDQEDSPTVLHRDQEVSPTGAREPVTATLSDL